MEKAIDFTETEGSLPAVDSQSAVLSVSSPYNPFRDREETRGDLARGLLWLLTFAIGGVLAFIGLGLLDGTVLTQSVFPSLIALAGTSLGFYFGSQNAQASDPSPPQGKPPLGVITTQKASPSTVQGGTMGAASPATETGPDASDTETAETRAPTTPGP